VLVITLVSYVGFGLWFGSFVLFLTRSVGLPAQQVGLGALVSGLVAVLVATPAGMLADRFGYRGVLFVLYLCGGLATAAYAAVHAFWPFVLTACVVAVAMESSGGVRTALTTVLADEHERMRSLAQCRVMSQLGLAVGAAGAAIVIQVDTRVAYLVMLAVTAVAYLACAVLVARLPATSTAAPPRERRRRTSVLSDRPYLVVTVLIAVLTLNWGMLTTGIPLWVVHHTDAPRWTSAAILVFNTVCIALLQVRFSRQAETTLGAMRAASRAGLGLAAACLILAATAGAGGAAAVTVLLLAAVVHTVAELLYVAASWGLSLGLMSPQARGEYQGMSAAGLAVAQAFTPLVMTTLVAEWGWPGWLVLAAAFAVAGTALTPATRWALRNRPHTGG
jgi:MFS family permease